MGCVRCATATALTLTRHLRAAAAARPSARRPPLLLPMLSSIRSRAPVAMCARAAVRTYYSSGSSSSAYGYGYTAYAPVEPASAWAADSAASSTSAFGCPADNGACAHAQERADDVERTECSALDVAGRWAAPPPSSFMSDSAALPLASSLVLPFDFRLLLVLAVVAPLECMNRNARKPSPANHGARPNSSYNRKRSSPEFGSWRHAGLRPGQTPPPRPQPGTPSCVAAVATGEKLEPSPAPISINKRQ